MVEPLYSILATSHAIGESGLNAWGGYVGSVLNGAPLPARNCSSLQAALNEVANGKLNIYIAPGTYDISAPLVIQSAAGKIYQNFHLSMYGVVLRATQNMDYLLDINGMAYSSIEGGWFTAAAGVTVGTMLRYGWDGIAPRSSTRNIFRNMVFEKNYGVGLQVGHTDAAVQTDNSSFENLTFGGGSKTDPALYQTGIYFVQNGFANTMLHTVRGCSFGSHKTGVLVDKVRHVRIEDASLSDCALDFDIRNVDVVEIIGTRSENGTQFLKAAPSGVTYPHNISLRGCTWDSPTVSGQTVIEFTQGTLNIDQLHVAEMPSGVIPKFSIGGGQRKAFASIRGLQVSTDITFAPADLFTTDTHSNIDVFGLVRQDATGQQIDADCASEWHMRDGV